MQYLGRTNKRRYYDARTDYIARRVNELCFGPEDMTPDDARAKAADEWKRMAAHPKGGKLWNDRR